MDLVKLRKTEILIEEIHHEFGPPPGRLRLAGGFLSNVGLASIIGVISAT
jgi:hypothetical protein